MALRPHPQLSAAVGDRPAPDPCSAGSAGAASDATVRDALEQLGRELADICRRLDELTER